MKFRTSFFVVLLIVSFFSVSSIVYAKSSDYDPVSMDLPEPDAEYPPSLNELLIPSNGAILSGFMLSANGKGPHPTALLMHGYPGNEKNLDLAQSLRRAGFNILFFHFRGAWGSQGDYSMFEQVDDVAAVLEYLRQNAGDLRVDTGKLSVIGHSMGGYTAVRAAAEDKELVCVVGLAAANMGEWGNASEQQQQGFSAYTDQLIMLNNYSGAKALAEMETNAETLDLRDLAENFAGRSILLITGNEDTAVPPEVQGRLFAAYDKIPAINITAELIPGDHSFSSTRIRLQRMVIAWMNQNCR